MRNAILNAEYFSDKIIMLQVKGWPTNVNIIQVYSPTFKALDEEIENFYKDLKNLLNKTKTKDANIVMGDFNAKIGERSHDSVVGKFGLGVRNARGDRLVQFCNENNLIIANVFQTTKEKTIYLESPSGLTR